MSLRYSYVTNGLGDHRLDDALQMLADNGYSGVGLTLDHHHLDPFAPDLAARVARIGDRLRDLDLAVVVETGARFVLDPRRKHEPTLLSDVGRERRVQFLQLAVRVAADLGAEAVSFWSGKASADVSPNVARARLVEGCRSMLETAHEHAIPVAFEPEPGMLSESIADWEQLSSQLDDPLFRLTLDVGHCLCTESESIPDVIRRVAPNLAYVQIDDMKRGVHEHLNFGDGDVEFPPALAALNEIGFQGLISVELSRHSHTAHTTIPESIAFLRRGEGAS
jgi:L-ribulose-5-phosphate 3-epimerase